MREQHAGAMASLDYNLRTTTIDPGKVEGGPIQFDIPKQIKLAKDGYPVTIVVNVGGEAHRFGGIVQKAK